MTYDQLDQLDRQLLAAINDLENTRQLIIAQKHKLQGPKRAGLYPGQLDNYVEAPDDEDCQT